MKERYSNKLAKGVFTVTAYDEEGQEVHKVVQDNLFTDLLENNLNVSYPIKGVQNTFENYSPIAIGIFDDQTNGGVGTESATDFARDMGNLLGYFEIGFDAGVQVNPLIGKRSLGEFVTTPNADGSITQKYVGEFSTQQGNGLINKLGVLATPYSMFVDRGSSLQYQDGLGGQRFNPNVWETGYPPYTNETTFSSTVDSKIASNVSIYANPLDTMDSIFTTVTNFDNTIRAEKMLINNGDYLCYLNPESDFSTNISIKVSNFLKFGYFTQDLTDSPVFPAQGFNAYTGAPLSNLGFADDGSMCSAINATTGDLFVGHMDTVAPNTLTIHKFTAVSNYATRTEHPITTIFTYDIDYKNGLDLLVTSTGDIHLIAVTLDDADNLATSITSTRVERVIINSSLVKQSEVGFTTNNNIRVGDCTSIVSAYYEEHSDSYLCTHLYRTAQTSIQSTSGTNISYSRISIPNNENYIIGGMVGSMSGANAEANIYGENYAGLVSDINSYGGSNKAAYGSRYLLPINDSSVLYFRAPDGSLIKSNSPTNRDYHPIFNQEYGVIYCHKITSKFGNIAILPLSYSVPKPLLAETLITPFLKDNTITIKVEYEVTVNPIDIAF